VDCVWRESSQWLGDALPQSLALWAMSADSRPIRQVIDMAAQGAYPDGILPSVMPAEVHAYTIPRYNMMWVELLHFYYQIAPDEAWLRSLWPTLTNMLAALDQVQSPAGLLLNPPGRRFYIDWSPTSTQEPHAVYNLHMVLAWQRAAELADALHLAAGGLSPGLLAKRPLVRRSAAIDLLPACGCAGLAHVHRSAR
jgi:hypothetical protein